MKCDNVTKVLALCCLVMLAASVSIEPADAGEGAVPDVTPSHRAAVVDLLEMTGVFARARTETNAVVERLRADHPSIPAEVWTQFADRVADRDALESLYVPIYAKHLPENDVRDVVAFYRTPAGAHLLEATPKIQEESRAAAQAWASEIAIDLLGATDSAQGPKPSVTAPQVPTAALSPARTAAVHELLRVSGTLSGARQIMVGMLERLRQGPQAEMLPPSFWDDARQRLTNEDDLLRLWTPAYAHHLTDAEIRGLVRFYRSPVGTRFVAALPAIRDESLTAGAQLGRDAAKRAVREVLGPLPQWRLQHPRASTPERPADAPPAGAQTQDSNPK
jgi:uncharacterized protein